MNLFNEDGRITKYINPEEIMSKFYEKRLNFYFRRKEYLVKMMKFEQKVLNNKARFVEEVCAGNFIVNNRKRKDLLAELKEKEYDQFPKEKRSNPNVDLDSEDNMVEESNVDDSDLLLSNGYNYLLDMSIWSLTYEKAENLRHELASKTQDVINLEATAPTKIWEKDLESIEEALNERDVKYKTASEKEFKAQMNGQLASEKNRNKTPRNRSEVSDKEFFHTEKKSVSHKRATIKIRNDIQVQLSKTEVLAKTLETKLKVSENILEDLNNLEETNQSKNKLNDLKSAQIKTNSVSVASSFRNHTTRASRMCKQVCYTLDESSDSSSSDFL
jgi:DNA gyrase/topoisomerase IV subunit A